MIEESSAGNPSSAIRVSLTSVKVGGTILVRVMTGILVAFLVTGRGFRFTGQLACWVLVDGPGTRADRRKGLGREVK